MSNTIILQKAESLRKVLHSVPLLALKIIASHDILGIRLGTNNGYCLEIKLTTARGGPVIIDLTYSSIHDIRYEQVLEPDIIEELAACRT